MTRHGITDVSRPRSREQRLAGGWPSLREFSGRSSISILLAALLCTACAKGHGGKPATPPTPNRVLYERAKGLIDQGRFEKAREALTEVGTHETVEPGLDPLVKIAVADAYFYQPGIENIIEAQSRYSQFVSFFPTHDLAGYAQFQIGMCDLKQSIDSFLDQTFTHKAIEEFDRVKAVDPGSRFVQAAEQMKIRCTGKIANHDYDVGVFYFKKKAWKGAVGRFKKLIEESPQYDDSDGAYYYLGVALVRDGSQPEGRIYLEKLARDYPRSQFISRAKTEIAKLPEASGQ